MVIRRPNDVGEPNHGKIQPMVKYCPTCKNDLEIVSSNEKNDNSHNYWCSVCNRMFEINYMSRNKITDDLWMA
jgi:transposase-like protein